jgi:GNAT superfamily N-acetyltransferase
MFSIRPAVVADAPAMVALRATVYPYLVRGAAATARMIAEPPPGEDWAGLVAEEAGEVVGWVSAYRHIRAREGDAGHVGTLHVHPDHRLRGIGDALFAAATGHLRAVGVRRMSGFTTPESLGFARRHGFAVTGEARYSSLELATFDPPPVALPEGVRVVPLREVSERALYEGDVAATADEPTEFPSEPYSYETWRYEVWTNDALDRDLSAAAIRDDEVIAFSLINRDGGRIWSDMTATRPAHRGEGLARLVKTAALRAAAAARVTVAYTSNDKTNAPMLAVNERLGYRPAASQLSCRATLPA